MTITLATLGLVGLLLSLKMYVVAGIVAVIGPLFFRSVKRTGGHDALSVRREEARIDLPSIVVVLIETEGADEAVLEAVR